MVLVRTAQVLNRTEKKISMRSHPPETLVRTI